MPDGNYVEVTVSAKDDTGPGFTAADARTKAFESAVTKSFASQARAAKLLHDPLVQATQDEAAWGKVSADAAGTVHVLSGKTDELSQKVGGAGRAASSAAGGFSSLAGLQGGGGMGALIGAGVALSPLLATLGFGLGGLGAAAAGVVDPILKASKASGGLQANMHKLDPLQQQAARSLLTLGKEYGSFQASLKPQVLGAWNEGLKIAGHLMTDVQPVAKATGNALNDMLAGLDREFQSGAWQQFFQFMGTTGAQDVRQLDGSLLNLVHDLPAVVQSIQPVTKTLLDMLIVGSKVSSVMANADGTFRQQAGSAGQASGALGTLGGTVNRFLLDLTPFGPDVRKAWDGLAQLASRSDQAAPKMAHLGTVTGDLIHPLGAVSGGLLSAARNADTEAAAARRTATGIGILTSALTKGLGPLESYIGATITQANDARTLEKALKASGDRIGYNTGAQRASFGAAQTYIGDLTTTATAAIASHRGIDQQIRSISNALPVLEGVSGKTSAYNAELAQLKKYLDQLRAEANIVKYVTVVENVTHIAPGGGLPGGVAGGFAHGGITGAATGGVRSGRVLLGEHGREAVDLAPGSRVHSNPDTERMLSGASGGSLTLEFHIPQGGLMLGPEFWTAFANGIRVHGGSKDILTRKVVFA